MRIQTFIPRFVKTADLAELSNLWHLSNTACSGKDCTRYKRILWASAAFHAAHPEVTSTAAYKDLGDMLDFGGR
jgi:hypothetical protein